MSMELTRLETCLQIDGVASAACIGPLTLANSQQDDTVT